VPSLPFPSRPLSLPACLNPRGPLLFFLVLLFPPPPRHALPGVAPCPDVQRVQLPPALHLLQPRGPRQVAHKDAQLLLVPVVLLKELALVLLLLAVLLLLLALRLLLAVVVVPGRVQGWWGAARPRGRGQRPRARCASAARSVRGPRASFG